MPGEEEGKKNYAIFSHSYTVIILTRPVHAMKKILLAVVLIATCMNAVAQDKAFEKGTIAAGLGAGFGIYITRAHETGFVPVSSISATAVPTSG